MLSDVEAQAEEALWFLPIDVRCVCSLAGGPRSQDEGACSLWCGTVSRVDVS